MKRITFFASFAAALFLLAGVTYFFLSRPIKASVVITNPRTENISGTGAQVKWETNIPSTSRVAYWMNAPLSPLSSSNRCDAGGYVTSHCVNLTGLAQGTIYSYKVESADTSGAASFLSGTQFTSAPMVLNDPTLPTPPSSLSVSVNTSGIDATFTWGDASSNETAFKMFRRLQGSTGWDYFISADANTVSFLYKGIPMGTYEYYVVACSGFGCSSGSNAVSVSRGAVDTAAPSIPQNVSATVVSFSQINLSWTASTDNVGVSGYNIYRDGTFVGSTASLSYSETALTSGTTYSYVVAAKDAAGNLSAGSIPAAATAFSEVFTAGGDINTDTTPPIISAITVKNIAGTGAQVTWETDEAANSVFTYGTVSGLYPFVSTWRCDTGGNTTSHCVNLTGLTPETPYYYQVASKNTAGYETKSAEQTFISASSTKTVSPTIAAIATTTTTALVPIVFSVKVGTPFCKDGRTFAPAYFTIDRGTGGYFTLKNGAGSVMQTLEGGSLQLPGGAYSWQGTPRAGYYSLSVAAGTLTVPALAACAPAAITPLPTTTTVANTAKTTSTDTKTAPKPAPAATAPVKNPPQEIVSAETFILLGTTTLSRITEPERIVSEVSRVISERTETSMLVDTDADGISDYDETHIYGTDPNKSDTDGDGIKDGDEILAGTHPLEKAVILIRHENPREVTVAAKADSKIFSVSKIEMVSATPAENGSTTKKYVTLEGAAPPNSFVTIYIFSTPVVVTVKTDSNGKWRYTMDRELEDGNHEIYVAMTESAGKIIVKSGAISFVKTAQAAELSSEFVLADTSAESPAAFFRGGTLVIFLIALFLILGLSLTLLSLILKKEN